MGCAVVSGRAVDQVVHGDRQPDRSLSRGQSSIAGIPEALGRQTSHTGNNTRQMERWGGVGGGKVVTSMCEQVKYPRPSQTLPVLFVQLVRFMISNSL